MVIFSDYLLNTKYITENFCVNKEKPKLKCNGKCHLAKELKHDEEKKSKGNAENVEIVMICQTSSIDVIQSTDNPISRNEDHFVFNRQLSDDQFRSVFHPPSNF